MYTSPPPSTPIWFLYVHVYNNHLFLSHLISLWIKIYMSFIEYSRLVFQLSPLLKLLPHTLSHQALLVHCAWQGVHCALQGVIIEPTRSLEYLSLVSKKSALAGEWTWSCTLCFSKTQSASLYIQSGLYRHYSFQIPFIYNEQEAGIHTDAYLCICTVYNSIQVVLYCFLS